MALHSGPARDAIRELHARGWTDTAIGRMVGRDSSLIHQIGAGKKPGRNLVGSLQTLADSGLRGPKSAKQLPSVAILSPERRRTARGLPARVREGAGGVSRLPNGAGFTEGHTKSAARAASGVARSMGDTARIQIAIRTSEGKTVLLGRKGGIRPETLDAYMKQHKTFTDALQAMLDDMYPVKVSVRGEGAHLTGTWHPDSPQEAQFFITEVSTPREP